MTKMFVLALVPLLAAAGPCAAQESPSQRGHLCEEAAGFNDWDFWLGEWNVYSNDDKRQFAGTNSITKHHAGCLIKEEWTGANGTGGFSINYYNPVRAQWRQVWVADAYAIDYTGGLNEHGQMVLEGELDNYRQNASRKFRGTWTPEENGDVIQRFEIHDPQTDAWSVWFEGRYVRK